MNQLGLIIAISVLAGLGTTGLVWYGSALLTRLLRSQPRRKEKLAADAAALLAQAKDRTSN